MTMAAAFIVAVPIARPAFGPNSCANGESRMNCSGPGWFTIRGSTFETDDP